MARTPLALPFSGERLREHRERRGLSRPGLARRCAETGQSVTPQHLGRLENGLFKPQPPLLKTLVDVLDIEVDDLLDPKMCAA